MKIINIEAIWLRVPALNDPIEWGEDAFIVRVHTDTGLVGIGESDSSPAVLKAIVETPPSHSTCRGLREILLGENPLDIERLWRKMFDETSYMGRRGAVIHAISAIDIALWDIAGQHYGVPVYQLLGGKHRDEIDAYATFIPQQTDIENREVVAKLLETGVTRIKLGGGRFGLDPRHDREVVREVRSIAGPDVELAVDLVYRWKSFPNARRQAEQLYEFNLAWIEEPIPSDDHIGLRRLSESVTTRISGGECLATYAEFDEFICETRPDIVQPDITRCGGISEMRRIYELAARHSSQLVPHGFSTGILLAATTQFLASVPNGDLVEYSSSKSPLASGLVANHIPLVNGRVAVSNEPGLGVVLDEDFLSRYRMDVHFARGATPTS
jgi:L-alanine-DL-glutamate epimerase-like enolase superfamily enzyme